MSELITTGARIDLRLHLLATVSALTLLTVITSQAKAEDADRPTVWVELGGQLERVDGGQEQFTPPFIVATPRPAPETTSPLGVGHAPRYSFGGEGKISFEPRGTDWVFSAAVRFGRSNAHKHLHQQSYPTQPIIPVPTAFPTAQIPFQYALPFSDVDRKDSESHTLLDFQVGKDVGVGMFGRDGSSVFNVGVRFAQFGAKSHEAFKSQPDFHPSYKYFGTVKFPIPKGERFHTNQATATTTQSFHGIGPSLSWNASAPFAGNTDDGEISFDWGINGALLFGRQKANVHHQTTARLHPSGNYTRVPRSTLYRHTPPDQARSKSVTVPNVGGFAGLSFRYDAAKVSFGYRADFFFGAMDGGIDARQSEDRNFFGPFAKVSVGLGG